MLEIFYTKKPVLSEAFIKNILTAYYNIPNPTICKTIHGKPYLIKSKICFNLTHSKGLTALAVGKHEVGFDCESLSGKPRPAVLGKFTEREKGEISSVQDFYRHWTARESYVKYLGEQLAALWRKVEFFGGKIYVRGEEAGVPVMQFDLDGYTFSICGGYTRYGITQV